jgi:ATP-binding cassette subfamily B protein
MPRVSAPLTVAATALTVVVGTAPVALSVVSAHLVSESLDAHGTTVPSSTLWLVLGIAVLLMVQEASRQALSYVARTLSRRVDVDLRCRALRASLSPIGISHLEDPAVRDIFGSTRNLSPFAFTPGDAAMNLPFSAAMRLTSLLALVVIAFYEPLMAVFALVVWLVVQALVVGNVVGTVASTAIGMLGENILYYRDLVLASAAAHEVRIFGLGGWLTQRFAAAARERMESAREARRGHWRTYVAAATVSGIGLAGGLLWIGLEGVDGTVTLTGVAVVASLLLRVFTVPNTIADVPIAYGMFAIPAIEAAEASSISTVTAGGAAVAGGPSSAIELRGVDFQYPGASIPVLRALDLSIPAGQRLAIVGLNGSGKTTLIKLLCRLYDPTAGSIVVDGRQLDELDPVAWRGQLAVLFQDFVHYDLSARDNVWLDAPRDDAGSEQLERAVEAAGAASIVGTLPSGWDTPMAAGLAGGVDLSGGQWQRVALARAMYAIDAGARLLILDEPTANLDPRGEQELFDSVLGSSVVRDSAVGTHVPVTTILVSHRFATVRHADRIVVLEGGRIVEDGDHAQLVSAGGRYQELFDAQAAAFREDIR